MVKFDELHKFKGKPLDLLLDHLKMHEFVVVKDDENNFYFKDYVGDLITSPTSKTDEYIVIQTFETRTYVAQEFSSKWCVGILVKRKTNNWDEKLKMIPKWNEEIDNDPAMVKAIKALGKK